MPTSSTSACNHGSCSAGRSLRARSGERGFSIVEIIIVLVIAGVLMGLLITTFTGSKKTTHYRVGQSAAVLYAEAIEAYMSDNGRRPPQMADGPNAVWPRTDRAARIGGPRDILLRTPGGQPKRYLPRAAPEAVSDGLVDLIAPGMTPAPSAKVTITYRVDPGDIYVLIVATNDATPADPASSSSTSPDSSPTQTPTQTGSGGTPSQQCVITNAPTPPQGMQLCR